MATKHPVTAIKAVTRDNVMVLSLMTRSPRGTQVPFRTIKIDKGGKSKSVFLGEVATEIDAVLNEGRITI